MDSTNSKVMPEITIQRVIAINNKPIKMESLEKIQSKRSRKKEKRDEQKANNKTVHLNQL